jgi:hypothetical protein
VYTGFSKQVDQINRLTLFRYLLIYTIGIVLGLYLLLPLNKPFIAYGAFVFVYFQWSLQLDILLPSMMLDYFTAIEYKRYTPTLMLSIVIGGLLGGAIASWLSAYLSCKQMLLILPVFCIIGLLQIFYIERTQTTIETEEESEEDEPTIVEALQTFRQLLQDYPILGLLAASSFLEMILERMGEFGYLEIYSQRFAGEQELTGFLGLIFSLKTLIQIGVIYGFTQPLIQRLGVKRMDTVYPLTTLGSFVGLAVAPSLTTALILNFNFSVLNEGIDQPVYQLNYNAVPHAVMGRAQTINEGLLPAISVALTGGFLWIAQYTLSSTNIFHIALIVSLFFLIIRYWMGKSYLPSMLSLLQSGSVPWKQVSEGLGQLTINHHQQVCELLNSNQIQSQILGLELAARLKNPVQVLSSVQQVLTLSNSNPSIYQAALPFLSINHPQISRYLGSLLVSSNLSLQQLALEALIFSQQPLTDAELRQILQRSAETFDNPSTWIEIQSLACIAAQISQSQDPEIQCECDRFFGSLTDAKTQMGVIREIQLSKNRILIRVLMQMIPDAALEIKREGLQVLAELATPRDLAIAQLAVAELGHPDPLVRAIALKLLGIVDYDEGLPQIAMGLDHPNLAVRFQAAMTLATYGDMGLSWILDRLYSSVPDRVEAAIAALGKIGSREAKSLLWDYLQPYYRLAKKTQRWRQQLPKEPAYWQPLRIAISDFEDQLIHQVLLVLSALDHQGTLTCVRQVLHSKDLRQKAQGLEILLSGKYQRFVQPILSLLESSDRQSPEGLVSSNQYRGLLLEALNSDRFWIMIGAFWVLQQEFSRDRLLNLPSLESILSQSAIAQEGSIHGEQVLKQVFFLKSIPIFTHLLLDELFLVAQQLESQNFLAGELVEINSHLFILYQGIVRQQVSDNSEQWIQCQPGDYWGEKALLDEADFILCTCYAETDGCLLQLSKSNFQLLIDRCPRLLNCLL